MVAGFVADRSEIEGQPVAVGEDVDVGVVGKQPVSADREAVGDRPNHRVGEQRDGSAIGNTGFEHVDRAGDTARFKIDQAVDPPGKRVAVEEGARTQQTEFLALVEQQSDGTRGRTVRKQSGEFEQGRHPDPVVGGAGPDRNAVIMGIDEEMPARLGAEADPDVADPGAGDPPLLHQRAAGKTVEDLWLKPECAKLIEQPVPDGIVGERVGGMRPLVAKQ